MGLDMYLNAKRYFWDDEAPKLDCVPAGYEVKEISVLAAYWRKANAIHHWFVVNVQDGVDNCRPHEVSREKLITLLELCRAILKDPSKGPELMPTAQGFFFGSYDYDQDYLDDLAQTVLQISRTLEAFDDQWDFEYCSSW